LGVFGSKFKTKNFIASNLNWILKSNFGQSGNIDFLNDVNETICL